MKVSEWWAMRRTLRRICPSSELLLAELCPICDAVSLLVNQVEVDVGVGVICGGQEWDCPEHGFFAVDAVREWEPVQGQGGRHGWYAFADPKSQELYNERASKT